MKEFNADNKEATLKGGSGNTVLPGNTQAQDLLQPADISQVPSEAIRRLVGRREDAGALRDFDIAFGQNTAQTILNQFG